MEYSKKEIILKIKQNDENTRIYPRDVPEEYFHDNDIVKIERDMGCEKWKIVALM